MEEIWKDIPGFEGRYQASTFGNVRSIIRSKPHMMSPSYHSMSSHQSKSKDELYRGVTLTTLDGKGKYLLLHRAVALTFLPNPENKRCINHIDGDPSNNHVENLEWCTHSENMYHAYRTGIRYVTDKQAGKITVEKDGELVKVSDPARQHVIQPAIDATKIKVMCVETGKIYDSMSDADRDIGCSLGYVSQVVGNGKKIKRKYSFVKISDESDSSIENN